MLADGPANLEIGLAADVARAGKVCRSQWHVLKAVQRVFRAFTPKPDPLETSGYVQQGMEHELRLNGQQICRADQREFRTEIRSSREKSVQRPECTRLSVVSADCICLQAETHAPHWAGKRPPEIPPEPQARISRFPNVPHWNPVSML